MKIDLKVMDISGDPDLESRYGLEIPVLLVDGNKAAKSIGEKELEGGCRENECRLKPAPRLPDCVSVLLLPGKDELRPPVSRPAGFVLFRADRAFLPLADRLKPVGGNPEADKVVPHRIRPAIPESEVVLVTVPRESQCPSILTGSTSSASANRRSSAACRAPRP